MDVNFRNTPPLTFSSWIEFGATEMESSDISYADARIHMKRLLEDGLEISSVELISRMQEPLSVEQQKKIQSLLERRLTGEPLQYLVKKEWFWEDCFEVGPGVLIPRWETEKLVEIALKRLPIEKIRVCELGAGSGNIGISLMKERAQWSWWAYEKSLEALSYAKRNAKRILGNTFDYNLIEGDFFELAKDRQFSALITNPPYISHADLQNLSTEVTKEPSLALDGGTDGFEVLRALIQWATGPGLCRGGWFISEIDSSQGQLALNSLKSAGFKEVEVVKDEAGRDRVLIGMKE